MYNQPGLMFIHRYSYITFTSTIFVHFFYVFIDAKTYNLDVFQHLKHINRYVFLAKKRKIFAYLLYH